ncbi:MAG TPA: hypothetical protein VG015_08440 [Candidatus Dormibacteraeota bacterium]|nr:hypothetical protein [Candidatus Dormibacteraeota bacterium]
MPCPVVETALLAFGAAVVAGLVGGALGSSRIGLALAAGLALGAVNPFLVSLSLRAGFEFRNLSLGRLILLTVAAVAIAGIIGVGAWVVILSLATAQAMLAIFGALESAR